MIFVAGTKYFIGLISNPRFGYNITFRKKNEVTVTAAAP
jgi:hypothetical protein